LTELSFSLYLFYQAFQLAWMTVWRQPGYDFKHVGWGAKVILDLCALEATIIGLVMGDLGIQKLFLCLVMHIIILWYVLVKNQLFLWSYYSNAKCQRLGSLSEVSNFDPSIRAWMYVLSICWIEIYDDNTEQVDLFHQKRWYDRVGESCSSKTYKLTQSEVYNFWLDYLTSQLSSSVGPWSKLAYFLLF
jgi:hypothetical protein